MGIVILRPDLAVSRPNGRAALLVGEFDRILLQDSVYCDLVESSKTAVDRQTLLQLVSGIHAAGDVKSALDDLERRELIVPAAKALSATEAAYWANYAPLTDAGTLLRNASVSLVSACADVTDFLTQALQSLQIKIGESGGLRLVLVPDYLHDAATKENLECLESRQSWLLLKPVGQTLLIGPLFVPGQSACYECLRLRLIENRWSDIPQWIRGYKLPNASRGALPTTTAVASAIMATEVAKWFVSGEKTLIDNILCLDTTNWYRTNHPVVRRKDCQCCANLGRPRLWKPTADVPPLLNRLVSHLSNISGFFHNLRDLTPSQTWPARIFGVNYTLPIAAHFPDEIAPPQLAVGRGLFDVEAKIGCLAEAVERRSLYFRGDEPRVRARHDESGGITIHPNELLLFSPSQYTQREVLNNHLPSVYEIPSEFDPSSEIEWIAAKSLLDCKIRLLPAELCYLRYPRGDVIVGQSDSTGCASGLSLSIATLSALYELIEREAAAIWWYNQIPRASVDLRSFNEPCLLAIEKFLSAQGRKFYLLDLTTDWEIPTYAAVSHQADGTGILQAFATHHEPARAAQKAATELLQVQLADQQAGSHGVPEPERAWPLEWNIADFRYIQSQETVSAPSPQIGGTPDEILEKCTKRARQLRLDIFAVELTRIESPLSVVRVVVPGMRSIAPRFAEGRLYTLPVELKWHAFQKTEKEMNPRPLVL